jgi:hypothetical protein
MNWNMEDDTLSVNFDRIEEKKWRNKVFTKRVALAMIASFFDPIDLMSPFYFQFKLMYREIEDKCKTNWDKPISEFIFKMWLVKFEQFAVLKEIAVPRCIIPWEGKFDVIIFCDASNDGYGVCSYVLNNGCPIILRGMSQIMNKKDMLRKRSSSHQEIHAAALSMKMRSQIETAFYNDEVKFVHYTDNLTVLCWLQNAILHPEIYVANRTEKIWNGSKVEEWRHVPGKENPADFASRGLNAFELKECKLWWNGPEWLQQPNEKWPEFRQVTTLEAPEALIAVRSRCKHRKMTTIPNKPQIDELLSHLNTEEIRFDQIADAIALLARWMKNVISGPLNEVYKEYKDNRHIDEDDEEKNRKRYEEWIKLLKLATNEIWSRDDRSWPDKKINEPEANFVVFSSCLNLRKPGLEWSAISPDERGAAGALLIRETQKVYFPNLWKMKGGDIDETMLNTAEKRAHKYFMIRYNETTDVLLVSGRVSEPSAKASLKAVSTRSMIKLKRTEPIVNGSAVPMNEEVEDINIESNHEDITDDMEDEFLMDTVDVLPFPNGFRLDDLDGLPPTLLMPGKGLISESILRDAHVNCRHGGTQKTLRVCNERVWMDSPSSALKKIRNHCHFCRYMRSKLLAVAEGCLPKDRTTCTRPFGIVGVDMTGPIYISYDEHDCCQEPPKKKAKSGKPEKSKDRGSGAHKKLQVYVMIITCCNTRALNVQICRRLTSLEIAQAFQKFCAERGTPDRVISDNARQFKQLKKLYQEAVRLYISPKNPRMYWKFIPTYSPWWGGFYESLIRPFKNILRSILPRMRIRDYLQAERVCKQAEACMNHRPLWGTPIGNDDVLAVTPFQFQCVSVNDKIPLHNNDTELEILKQLKSAQSKAMATLWYKVRMSHLNALQKFHRQRSPKNEQTLKVGDLVLLKNDMSARSFWPIARITEVYPNERGVFRTVSVEKYVPNEINSKLKQSLFGKTPESKLTKRELRQITGYFKPVQDRQAVRNLVRFELWNPEIGVHPTTGAVIGKYGVKETLLRSHVLNFENFTKPTCKYENDTNRLYSKQSRMIQGMAESLYYAHRPSDPETEEKTIKHRKRVGM